MMRYLKLSIIIAVLFCFTLNVSPQSFDTNETQKEIQELREDISLANLINGLYLSEQQMKEVITLAKETQTLKQEYKSKNSALIGKTKTAFTDLRNYVFNGDTIPKEIGTKARQYNEKGKELREQFLKEMVTLENRAKSILTEG